MAKRVIIFGKFDILHPGHMELIRSARKLGQVTVVLESDQAIGKFRNYLPYNKESLRKNQLQKLGLEVYLRNKQNAGEILTDLKPDILVFGQDQLMLHKIFSDFKNKKIIPLVSPEIFKSSKLRSVLEDRNTGIYLVDKKKGVNSFNVVTIFRKILNIKKVGFSGTLDPLASGLLIVATGSATRLLDWFHFWPKIYIADILFGQTSDTFDLEGKITQNKKAKPFSQNELEKVLQKFVGRQIQLAPIYSAKKIGGQKLHKLARQGKEVARPAKEIEIYNLKIKSFRYPNLKLEVSCSVGTYIRSLADDLGQAMKTGALLADLRRDKIGDFSVDQAIVFDQIDKPTLAKKRIEPPYVIDSLNRYFLDLTD
ncbi:tRNA pseudouridine(55) synthase TruB [Patescibacteria group bacterium]|nr:tRNA pseudouridine(55) synthase TruB [Patescibacteria group bacterium]